MNKNTQQPIGSTTNFTIPTEQPISDDEVKAVITIDFKNQTYIIQGETKEISQIVLNFLEDKIIEAEVRGENKVMSNFKETLMYFANQSYE